MAAGAWVSHLVLMETVWVLASVYGLDRKQQGLAIEMLLDHVSVVVEAPETVAGALASFRADARAGFSGCLVLEVARRAGHAPFATFDRRRGKLRDVAVIRSHLAAPPQPWADQGRYSGVCLEVTLPEGCGGR